MSAKDPTKRPSSLESHVKTGDSMSWTSLSICMSMLTVMSSSALPWENVSMMFNAAMSRNWKAYIICKRL